ncbi:THAP domain-containing protein 2-like [Nelusetta ayraudi]|uniref:THAP domain-containing protein 2-like n=1 Tax=Nelusetta ayraudi TaxID=303726 RepID=UPI003F7238A4
MPEHCAAYSCANRRTVENRARGITFHKFPKDKVLRKQWEVALRRDKFTASDSSVLCSEHFKEADFDRTGQIVRLKDGVIPSIFHFPDHLQRVEKSRSTSASRKAEESPSMTPQDDAEASTSHSEPQHKHDHNYVMASSPNAVKARLTEALERVQILEREKKTAEGTGKEGKSEKNLINEELKDRLEFFSDLNLDFMAKLGHQYSKEHREFALTLHLHSPKVYKYLRDTMIFPLPHPHTIQRWLCSVDDKPGLNKMMLDIGDPDLGPSPM